MNSRSRQLSPYFGFFLVALTLVVGLVVLSAAGGSGEAPSAGAQGEQSPGERAQGEPLQRASREPSPEQAHMSRLIALSARFGSASSTDIDLPPEYQNQAPPPRADREFSTDFTRAAVSFNDIIAGGPPKDGIPAIDEPSFERVAEADRWLEDQEPVILVRAEGQAKVYPLRVLTWHEIVNDSIGGLPVAVTYCPLCNTGMVFERRLGNEVLDFGVSGRLIYSNMIMYDRPSETWWIQATGAGIAGKYTGHRLRLVPSSMLAWRDVKGAFPAAEVLSRATGYARDYGRNPYQGYDRSAQPFLYRGPDRTEQGENPMERVLTVYHGETARAVLYTELFEHGVLNLELEGQDIAVFGKRGTSSALDSSRIPEGRDVGSAAAYYAHAAGQALSFVQHGEGFRDNETGSLWDITGRALSGPLAGTVLEPAPAVEHFLFSYRAFHGYE
ncbi:MAG: DUF3179 domain-containing protein [Spirochaetaceae bacterium]|nr:MAG: DUF3179 domain-containing protein [Spirochaetaceae bacterium]